MVTSDSNKFVQDLGISYPILCGAMYPCSNPELIAAVSHAGGMGIVQPVSLVFVHKFEFRAGLQYIRSLTPKPIGMNIITEKSSRKYQEKMEKWLQIALEEGVRFFVTSLGNPKWVVDAVSPYGGIVYHDITDRKWAEKAVASGVHGLICVNRQAGGHAGQLSSQNLYDSLKSFGLPLIAAGGCSTHQDYTNLLKQGYAGVQMGTRFIVSNECNAHADYKAAILKASADDVVLTDKISGVPVSVIKTPYIERIGTKASPLARYLLQNPKTKHYMRMFYTLRAAFRLKEASLQGSRYQDYWQAGKSVEGCSSVLSAHDIIQSLVKPKP